MQTPATTAPWVKRLALGLLLAVGGILLGSLLDGLSPEEETADGTLSTRDASRPLPPFRLQQCPLSSKAEMSSSGRFYRRVAGGV